MIRRSCRLQNALTQSADMRLHRAQLEHAIAVLTGNVPSAFQIPPVPLDNMTPPSISTGLPSVLLPTPSRCRGSLNGA